MTIKFNVIERPKMKTWTGKQLKYVQVKLDGHFTYLCKSDDGIPAVFTRQGTDITAKCKTYKWFRNFIVYADPGVTVMGELWHPEHNASYVKTALKDTLPLEFSTFAISTMPADAKLEDVHNASARMLLPFINYLYNDGSTLPAVPFLRSDRIEGYVYKDGNLINWQRYKPTKTVDCVIKGFVRGDGKYFLTLGSLEVGVYHNDKLIEIANVGGMTDNMRDYIWENKKHLIGKVVEVEYQRVDTRGRLRHPNFLRFREPDEKLAADCVIEQDPLLLENLQNV